MIELLLLSFLHPIDTATNTHIYWVKSIKDMKMILIVKNKYMHKSILAPLIHESTEKSLSMKDRLSCFTDYGRP